MPWKASSVMEERLRSLVARLLDGEPMTDVCRDFGVSRKIGYKILDRYKEHGLAALSDRSRRPVRYANQLPQPIESLIVRLKAENVLGCMQESASSYSGVLTAMSGFQPRARSMQFSIATAWSSAAAGRVIARATGTAEREAALALLDRRKSSALLIPRTPRPKQPTHAWPPRFLTPVCLGRERLGQPCCPAAQIEITGCRQGGRCSWCVPYRCDD